MYRLACVFISPNEQPTDRSKDNQMEALLKRFSHANIIRKVQTID